MNKATIIPIHKGESIEKYYKKSTKKRREKKEDCALKKKKVVNGFPCCRHDSLQP